MTAAGQQISSATPHPAPARLAAFGLGKLGDDESAVIAEHVSDCDSCRLLVAAVADDTLADLFREANDRRTVRDRGSPATAEAASSGYEILEVVGEGGMGVVYKARQRGLDRIVALKQVRPEALAGLEGAPRFRREAEAAARLRHPNIVPIFDVGRLDGVPYYAMEFVEGGSLAGRLEVGPVSPTEAARLVETLARAIEHAHQAGVVHRDLKPGNVLLAPDLTTPKIGDFGLAKWVDDDGSRTKTGAILGTPNYMAPEQAAGDSRRVGPLADIYALGAILYEALTGRPPFSAASTLETLELVRLTDPMPPGRVRDGLPRDLETIALKCLEKSPGRRYESARALANDLRRHLDGEPIEARPLSSPERLAKWTRRRPWQAASAAIAALALVGLIVGVLIHNARLRAEVARTDQKAVEAREQSARADAQYRSARDAIQKIFGRIGEAKSRGAEVPAEFSRQVLEDALAFYENVVRDDGLADPSARIDKARALREAATLQFVVGRHDEAERGLRRGLALLDGLEPSRPDDAEMLREQIDCANKLGLNLVELRRFDAAIEVYDRAIERAERLLRSGPDRVDRIDLLAWTHHNFGDVLFHADRRAEAEPHFRRAVEIRLGLVRDRPDMAEIKARLAESLMDLAVTHMQADRPDEAEREYAQAADLLGPISLDPADHGQAALALGNLYLNWGTLAFFRDRPVIAAERYAIGAAAVDRVRVKSPDRAEVRLQSKNLHTVLAKALDRAERHADAARAWKQSLALADDSERRDYRLMLGSALARAGDHRRALAEADEIAAAPGTLPGEDFYNLACIAALAAASVEKTGARDRADDCADRAMGWLARSFTLGFFHDPQNLATLDGDADLDALRPRRDFQLLRLDAAFPTDPFAPKGKNPARREDGQEPGPARPR